MLPNTLHVIHDDGVIEIVGVAVELSRNAIAQLALGAGREVAAVAQIGQTAARGGAGHGCRLGIGEFAWQYCYQNWSSQGNKHLG